MDKETIYRRTHKQCIHEVDTRRIRDILTHWIRCSSQQSGVTLSTVSTLATQYLRVLRVFRERDGVSLNPVFVSFGQVLHPVKVQVSET